jgi:glycosyltransferase involved in cell wall biosynthesis
MRIALATESYYPNIDGGAIMEHRLALAMAGKGHEVFIFAPSTRGYKSYVEEDGPTKIFRQRSLPLIVYKEYNFSPFPLSDIELRMREIKPDILHVHNPYGIGISAVAAARGLDIPIIGTNHLMPENFFNAIRWTRPLYRLLKEVGWKVLVSFYNLCDIVTSPTETAVRLLVNHGLRKKALAISNGVDVKRFNPSNDGSHLKRMLGIPSSAKVVLYTGRLSGEKKVDVLIRAAKIVLERVEDVYFVIGGRGREMEYLISLSRRLGIYDRIRFPGYIPDPDLPSLYAMADVFAMPSDAELQSIVTLEAMASGLPVVAADAWALPEIVHHGENGFLFAPNNSEEMARWILELLEDPSLRRRMGIKGREIAERHEFSKVVDEFEKAYMLIAR